PAPTDIYSLSLHDALPISPALFRHIRSIVSPKFAWIAVRCQTFVLSKGPRKSPVPAWFRIWKFARWGGRTEQNMARGPAGSRARDRKRTRLNSSHDQISYA